MNDINKLFSFGWIELIFFYLVSFFLILFVLVLNKIISKKNIKSLNLIGAYLSIGLGVIFFLIFGIGKDFTAGGLFIRYGNEMTIRISSFLLAFLCLFTYPKAKKIND